MKNKLQNNWWSKPTNKVRIKPLADDTKGLVQTAVGSAVALTALGIGVAAFDAVTD